MILAKCVLLFAALVLDRLFGEPPNRLHPVCMIGALAIRLEVWLRHERSNRYLFFAGALACLLTVVPCTATAGCLVLATSYCLGPTAEWLAATCIVYICLAPRSLAEHAQRVAQPLLQNDIKTARKAVSMLVGRCTDNLDAHGLARACVESVAENLTDGVVSTLFWAGMGMMIAGFPGAAALAVFHRTANILDALWGKKNETYIHFGVCAARLDDALNFFPARLAMPCVAVAGKNLAGLRCKDIFRVGWKFHNAHESPNSAWTEAAFAGALGLQLGGPAIYGQDIVDHPWLGEGTRAAQPEHIQLAITLLRRAVIVFTSSEMCIMALANSI